MTIHKLYMRAKAISVCAPLLLIGVNDYYYIINWSFTACSDSLNFFNIVGHLVDRCVRLIDYQISVMFKS